MSSRLRAPRGREGRAIGAVVGLLASLLSSSANAEPRQVALAGERLQVHPYFNAVDAFGPGEVVQVALDTTRHPDLAGATCHVWIVHERSAEAWSLDATLVDARPLGPQTVTLSGSTIQANTFVAAAPGLLDSDAGDGLGVGYDVVFDCNRNGVLDDLDLLDGGGDEPAFWMVDDTSAPGPLAVAEVEESWGFFLTQRIYYPRAIATLGRLPVVFVGHGWTHDYLWYDHIGYHLASHGYVVVSFRNNVGSGDATATNTASSATVANVDVFLSQLPSLAGGVLADHVDGHRIVLIGHSTGGEGVVRAYTRIANGELSPQSFTSGDIVAIVSLAPVSFHNGYRVNPGNVPYHLILGAADTDTANGPVATWVQPISIFERATGPRHLTYIHGAGHGWLHNGDADPWAFGPGLIGRAATHEVLLGYLLPFVELYAKENSAAADFLHRSFDDFRPAGIDEGVVVAKEFRAARGHAGLVIDDYQSEPSVSLSSSGGTVVSTVSHVEEVVLGDLDGSFDWTDSQPSNGMTRARFPEDDTRGVVFDWYRGTNVYELEIPEGQRDHASGGTLSFRAAQGTRHPRTDALDAPMSFTVALVDGQGRSSAIDFAPLGYLTRPYERTGYGGGVGWANEFGTVRLALENFTRNGSQIDLGDLAAVRFLFGGDLGSKQGRIGLDDVEILPPGAAPRLTLVVSRSGPGAARFEWPAIVGAGSYDVLRGTIPHGGLGARGSGLDVYDHACLDSQDSAGDGRRVAHDDEPVPVDRAGFYYLVTTRRTSGELSAGLASVDLDPDLPGEQRRRPVPTCP